MTEDELRQWFAYQPPSPAQQQSCILVRTAMYKAAEQYRLLTPHSVEQRETLQLVKAALQAMLGHIVAPMPTYED